METPESRCDHLLGSVLGLGQFLGYTPGSSCGAAKAASFSLCEHTESRPRGCPEPFDPRRFRKPDASDREMVLHAQAHRVLGEIENDWMVLAFDGQAHQALGRPSCRRQCISAAIPGVAEAISPQAFDDSFRRKLMSGVQPY